MSKLRFLSPSWTPFLEEVREAERRRCVWLVSFMDYDLGYIDLEERSLQPLEIPFAAVKM